MDQEERRTKALKACILQILHSQRICRGIVSGGVPAFVSDLNSIPGETMEDIETAIAEMDANDSMPLEYAHTSSDDQIWLTDMNEAYDVLSRLRDEIYET